MQENKDAKEDKLIIGVPSKGRLQENTFSFFSRAGLPITQPQGARAYRGSIINIQNVEIAFLSASEIVGELAAGNIHIGVTGEDLINEQLSISEKESDIQKKVELLTPLGFGNANVIVAVPDAWIDVQNMADLEEVAALFRKQKSRKLRVATKYINLTRNFFKKHGISEYRIVESAGATEGAPASGLADIIVDITTTGATLAANSLKIIEDGTILKSQAHLVASCTAIWNEEILEKARIILSHISAEEEARKKQELHIYHRSSLSEDFLHQLASNKAIILEEATQKIIVMVDKEKAPFIADMCLRKGATSVIAHSPEYIFTQQNQIYKRLENALKIAE